MTKSRLVLFAAGAALFLFGAQAFAEITVDVVAPDISFTGNDTALDSVLNSLFDTVASTQFQNTIDQFQTDSAAELNKYGEQDSLAKGFADANLAASQSGTFQAFEGYKIFAVSIGMMVGIQLPSNDFGVISDLSESVKDDPDVYMGVAPSMSVNVGFNMGKLLGFFNNDLGDRAKKFYVNVKGGVYNGSSDATDTTIDMKSTTFGIGVNYQLLPPINLGLGLLKWRGLSIGSGLTYQRNNFDSTTTLDPITQQYTMTTTVGSGPYSGTITPLVTLTSTPKIDIGVDMKTFSIPLEALTSVQVLWVLNVNFGVGADLVFGKSEITATSSSQMDVSDVTVNGTHVNYHTDTPGSVTVDASTTGIKPTFARARVMGGLGINAGPFKFDVPMYYYFSSGYGLGMTVGFVW